MATGAAPSRGALPVLAATGAEPPLDALARIGLQDFPGFNLVLADLARGEAALLCNRAPQAVRRVAPGLHGLSNGHTWPKVAAGVAALEALAATGAFDAGAVPWEEVRGAGVAAVPPYLWGSVSMQHGGEAFFVACLPPPLPLLAPRPLNPK